METYRKIIIKSESDLPKEDGWFYVAKKNSLKTSGLKPMIFTIISKKKWLNEVEFYLQPTEPKRLTDSEIENWARERLIKDNGYPEHPFSQGMIDGAKFARDFYEGEG